MTTVLLVDDDPFQAHVRRSVLKRHFHDVERVADAAEAFILIEDVSFAERVGFVIVALNRPGIGNLGFVTEFTSRVPSVPVLVIGQDREESNFYQRENVRFLPRTAPTSEFLALSRQMMEQYSTRVA